MGKHSEMLAFVLTLFCFLFCSNRTDIYFHLIIFSAKQYNFAMKNPASISNRGFSYDYSSVMQYGSYAFTTDNSLRTMVPKNCVAPRYLGRGADPTPQDYAEINELYHCDGKQKII